MKRFDRMDLLLVGLTIAVMAGCAKLESPPSQAGAPVVTEKIGTPYSATVGVYPDEPDPKLTPGAVRCSDLPCILSTEKAAEAGRPTQSQKLAIYKEYGLTPDKSNPCEVDHLISIEIGGANDPKNYWIEHYSNSPGHPGAHIKDRYEDWLGANIRSPHPKYTVPQAQQRIAIDWIGHYREDIGPLPTDVAQKARSPTTTGN